MKFKTRIKIILPMLISIIRILLIPFIIILNLNNKNIICIILIIIGFLTNILDDKIANKFYTKTKLSKNIDEISNIAFLTGICISFIKKNTLFIPISIIQFISLIIIILITIKHELTILEIDKKNRINIIILCLITYFIKQTNLIYGFSFLTLNLSLIVSIHYITLFIMYNKKEDLGIDNYEAHKKIMNETDEIIEDEIMKTKAIQKIEDIIEKYEEK